MPRKRSSKGSRAQGARKTKKVAQRAKSGLSGRKKTYRYTVAVGLCAEVNAVSPAQAKAIVSRNLRAVKAFQSDCITFQEVWTDE